jgi:NAD(P)-dependent dehydrogenase (short-subunit alcohol dehydrogenase family)
MASLDGKVAIVTGASSGIGRASALLFAREGARIVAAGRRQPELDALVAEIRANGGEAEAVAGDVRDEDHAVELVERAVARFGRLDIALNNAGGMIGTGPSTAVSRAAWTEALDTNLTGAFLGAKHQIPHMIEAGGGSVIFTSSYVGVAFGFPQAAAYAASKAALTGLAQTLASEFGPSNVRVNALVPGSVDTPAYREKVASPEQKAFLKGLTALKRVATEEELARSALFLASDASAFMTGASLVVDGGASINRT